LAFTTSNGDTRTSLAEINITPLVDVVLVLLIIFMITEPVLQSGIHVDVPQTRTVSQITQQRMMVTVDASQNIYLNDKPINIHALTESLRSSSPDPTHQVIYLAADRTIPFGVFCKVMDAVKQAGITNVSIITQPLDTKKSAAGGD
jgi:biopolymer transport protein TolR